MVLFTSIILSIQKFVVICLMIPTLFPFDDASIIEKITRMYEVRCSPWSDGWKISAIIQSSIKRYPNAWRTLCALLSKTHTITDIFEILICVSFDFIEFTLKFNPFWWSSNISNPQSFSPWWNVTAPYNFIPYSCKLFRSRCTTILSFKPC
jgi:hypothetical protein